jgi:hypothetical protein
MKQEHIGSDFDDFLKQDGLLAKCEAGALKRVVAWQIERETKVNFPRQTRQPHENQPRGTRPPVFSKRLVGHASTIGTSRTGSGSQAQD